MAQFVEDVEVRFEAGVVDRGDPVAADAGVMTPAFRGDPVAAAAHVRGERSARPAPSGSLILSQVELDLRALLDRAQKARARSLVIGGGDDVRVDVEPELLARLTSESGEHPSLWRTDDEHVDVVRRRPGLVLVTGRPGAVDQRLLDTSSSRASACPISRGGP